MNRHRTILAVYVLAVLILAVAMTWVTRRTLKLEREEQRTALSAENERLALWRMDSMLLPLIQAESSRDYTTLVPWETATIVTPSALPTSSTLPQFVQCYFHCDAAGEAELLTLQHSASHQHNTAVTTPPASAPSTASVQQLAQTLAADVGQPSFFARLHTLQSQPAFANQMDIVANQMDIVQHNAFDAFNTPVSSESANDVPDQSFAATAVQQQARSFTEFQNRFSNNSLAGTQGVLSQILSQQGASLTPGASVEPRPLVAFWQGSHLYLTRRVDSATVASVQGCLLNWPALKAVLLARVQDLLPQADLIPIADNSLGERGEYRSLATIPVRLIPGRIDIPPPMAGSPLQISLFVAWGWLAFSILALGGLLFGVVQLSERRAAFVSAVTHELRTPLTTFQLYCDLLAQPRSLTSDKHSRYVETLRIEAERLAHLVENVLSWSRLEQSADTALLEPLSWTDVWERIARSLHDRAEQAGMSLHTDISGCPPEVRFLGNRTSVERILFNLLDNACKYAVADANIAEESANRINIEVTAADKTVDIRIRDHGPGIPKELSQTLFRPFTKSATEAAQSKPGVGLGLSLCRRLARNMQGDLILEHSSPTGTTFQLTLPRA